MKIVVSAGVSKNGPGAVWVEEETMVEVGNEVKNAMVVRTRIRQLPELLIWEERRRLWVGRN